MPQTVPNRPTNGATEEMTARLGSPPSDARQELARGARHRVRDARPQFADRLARNAPARFLVARGGDAGKRFRERAARARLTHRAAKAHDRNHALDDQHPAPERGDEQNGHDGLADETRLEKQPDRR